MGNLILFARGKKTLVGLPSVTRGSYMRLQKNKCGLVSDGKWPPASDPNKADTSERTQRSAESSIFFSGSCELGVNARSGGEHCKIHGFTHLPFKFVAADSKQININVAQKRFLVWHTVPHRTYGMITAALKPERKQTRFRHRPGHCCPLKLNKSLDSSGCKRVESHTDC